MALIAKKILITGAQGQVGLQCLNSLSASETFRPVTYSHQEFNICDPLAISKIFKQDFSAVINCAAYTAVDQAQSAVEQAWQVNALAPKLLAKACALKQVPLIHFSSDYVYDNGSHTPLKETDPCNPKSIYAISKYIGEQEALYYHRQTVILRTSWVYSRKGQNFVNTILKLSKEKEELNIVHDQFGSPTYTPDLVHALLQILNHIISNPPDHSNFGIFNYSNSGNISWFDFASEIIKSVHSPCKLNPVQTSGFPRPAPRPFYSVFDLNKIQSRFGITPSDWKGSLLHCLNQD